MTFHVLFNKTSKQSVRSFVHHAYLRFCEAGKHTIKVSSRSEANNGAAHAEVVRERSTEQDTLQLGAFMRAKDRGLSKVQFDRVSMAYEFWYDKEKVGFHIDDVNTGSRVVVRTRTCITEAECSTDEHAVGQSMCFVQLTAADRAQVMSPSRQKARVQLRKTRCMGWQQQTGWRAKKNKAAVGAHRIWNVSWAQVVE